MKHFLAAVGAAALLLSAPALPRAQEAPVLPNTKPGEMMSQWLKLCDAADAARMKQWAETNLPERLLQRISAAVFARRMAGDCVACGGYTVLRILESRRDQLDVLALARRTNVYVRLRLAATPEGKAAQGVDTAPVLPPQSGIPADVSDQGLTRWLNQYVSVLGQAGQFSGIAVVARGAQPIATARAGYADRAEKTPVTARTQFTIGSMGKMFTAVAVGELVDQGKLSFDDAVGKFFPGYANETVREKVTVAMLLSHTSGMRDFLGERTPEMMTSGVKRAAEFVPLYENDGLLFEPGSRWSYSNAGFALLGAIVERASGETYPIYLRKHIFDPAGMKDSDPNNIPHMGARMATPYTFPFDSLARLPWREAGRDLGSPAGGAISTAGDLVRFADALRGGKLVSTAAFRKMTEGRPTPTGGSYGYGMDVSEAYGVKVIGHGGGFPGVSTELYILLNSPYTVVVLANQDPPAAGMVGEAAKAVAAQKARQALARPQ